MKWLLGVAKAECLRISHDFEQSGGGVSRKGDSFSRPAELPWSRGWPSGRSARHPLGQEKEVKTGDGFSSR